jgi:hypothetical protein
MTPIEFSQQNVVYGAEQDEYLPLPAYQNRGLGIVITAWQMSDEERETFLKTGIIYLQTMTFNQPLQPVQFFIENPFIEE